jgi:hypothetical protein
MDLFGPISIQSPFKKKYVYVIVDDYSHFFEFFLKLKKKHLIILLNFLSVLKIKNVKNQPNS